MSLKETLVWLYALTWNFMFPVPDASVPAVEICSERSVAGITKQRNIIENSGVVSSKMYVHSAQPHTLSSLCHVHSVV